MSVSEFMKTQVDLLEKILGVLERQLEQMGAADPETDDNGTGESDTYSPENVSRFVQECLVRYVDRQMPSEQMAAVWKEWCRENEIPLGRTNRANQSFLARSLGSEGIKSVRLTNTDGSRSRIYLGVGLSSYGKAAVRGNTSAV